MTYLDDEAVNALLQRSFGFHQQGRLKEAGEGYAAVLQARPGHGAASFLYGVLALQSRQPEAAIERLTTAIAAEPGNTMAYLHRGAAYEQTGRPADALASYDEAIAVDPDGNAGPYVSRGHLLMALGRAAEALTSYERAIFLESDLDADAQYGRGAALLQLGQPAEALTAFDTALKLGTRFKTAAHVARGVALGELNRPGEALHALDLAQAAGHPVADVALARGRILQAQQRWTDAANCYLAALGRAPTVPALHTELARAQARLGQGAEALASLGRALAVAPGHVDAHHLKALLLADLGQPGEALVSLERLFAIRAPSAADCLVKSSLLLGLGRSREALAAAEQATVLEPASSQAWFRRGLAHDACQELQAAERCFDEVLALKPDHVDALTARAALRVRLANRAGAEEDFGRALSLAPLDPLALFGAPVATVPAMADNAEDAERARLRFAQATAALTESLDGGAAVNGTLGVGSTWPFYLAYQDANVRELVEAYAGAGARLLDRWLTTQPAPATKRGRSLPDRLRVGFVSAQVCDHSVYNALTRGWIRKLDRTRFEVEVFHLGQVEDAFTAEARARASHFSDGSRGLAAWVAAIRDRAPDVLVYPELGMDKLTLQLASLRLAPRQLTAWGHPVTSGLPTMDGFVSAAAFEPADAAAHYSERLFALPRTGVYYDLPLPATLATPVRSSVPVFACAGTPFKYLPQYDHVYVDIARELGQCEFHFFVYRGGELTDRLLARLAAGFTAAGLDPARCLRRVPWQSPAGFHAHLQGATVYLDSLGFSGFNTALQAIGCGLPVVAFEGRYLRSRFASGIVGLLGAPDLIARSAAEFVALSVALARDSGRRRHVADALVERLPTLREDEAAVESLATVLSEPA